MDVVDFAKHVYKKIQQRENDISMLLLTGAVKDHEQYRHLVGEAQGLSFAKDEIKSLLESTAEDVEDLIRS
jgi:NAD(P)H-nitrite reductase large subunit|tara:strand:+ start:720 stop:932 length:213 start_codon:yes stop_codon:yes gene_type:complete